MNFANMISRNILYSYYHTRYYLIRMLSENRKCRHQDACIVGMLFFLSSIFMIEVWKIYYDITRIEDGLGVLDDYMAFHA